MISSEKRQSIYTLHKEGHSDRKISQMLQISRTTVKCIISEKGELPAKTESRAEQDLNELIKILYESCQGRAQRVYERLTEEKGIDISYSSVTRRVRELELNRIPKRSDRVADQPGEEMQHDTTIYQVRLGDKKEKLVASVLYFRYSKMKYLKLYRSFDRFRMKCFLHEALTHFGYSARTCIIDNTNLARLSGSGSTAVITEEMSRFSSQYGFQFICHELNHPNRKAGNERSFWTVETNFLPGRTFQDMTDLNNQALQWATVKMANRPISRSHLIPAAAFESEKHYLNRISEYIPNPYRQHERIIDQYGYIAFAANYYWIPKLRSRAVTVLEYADRIKIFHKQILMVEYPLVCSVLKNQIIKSDKILETRIPNNFTHKAPEEEEKRLRSISDDVDHYMTWILSQAGLNQRPKLIRSLFRLSGKMEQSLFISTIQRAAAYKIADIPSLENIAFMQLREKGLSLPETSPGFEYENRNAFQQGRLSCQVDFSVYNQFLQETSDAQ